MSEICCGVSGALLKYHCKLIGSEPDKVELKRLHDYVTQLNEFKGDPQKFDEQTLQAIRSAWIAEFLERTRNWA